jgi:hypothetical protein
MHVNVSQGPGAGELASVCIAADPEPWFEPPTPPPFTAVR